ncbi:hypothetical protein BGW36DRAFT_397170 [Talaromyces proteolyticus]|uniref:BZIP domain-containing protein n=1 Tax=Talaromyces proteolyticus TaxID=1131652 RepID=A0AAD4KR60_9EURO|nr:uncharacterized protein BGW36DRAFT_397170 [Talaromyces proteolyticus]KAH8697466.1 hypothetical protein BGW36DRAFT_397170 [Talaromyces proteolyticus]
MSSSDIVQDFPLDLYNITTASPLLDDLTSPASSMMASPETFMDDYSYMANYPSGAAPPGTVSPKDLTLSGPPSTSFSTDLGTPQSYYESPDGISFSHDISPAFANMDGELPASAEHWLPLVSSDIYPTGEDLDATMVTMSMNDLSKSKARPVEMVRSVSSPAPSPGKSAKKLVQSAGVNARRQSKALPKIVYDPADPAAAKRARNTEAARKSRMRKVEKQQHLEEKVEELEDEISQLKDQIQFWAKFAPAGVSYSPEVQSEQQ